MAERAAASTRYVLWLASWYPHRDRPLQGLFVQAHARAAAQVVPVVLVSIHPSDRSPTAWVVDEPVLANGVCEIRGYYSRKAGPVPGIRNLVRLLRFWQCWRKAWQQVRKQYGMPALVHLQVLYPLGLIAAWLKLRHRLPYLVTEHSSGFLPNGGFAGKSALHRWLVRHIAKDAKHIYAVSAGLAAAMQAHGMRGPAYSILPNVVDTHRFRPAAASPPAPAGWQTFRILHVSFLDRKKNLPAILRAFEAYRRTDREAMLEIGGDGPDRPALERLAAELGLGASVRFLGPLPPAQVALAMQQAHVFLFPSLFETFGVVAIESIACGTPVIGTRVGAMAEIIQPSTGLLLDDPSPEAIVSALQHMRRQYAYNRAAMHAAIQAQYSPQALAARFEQMYAPNA